jgi:hypothetical protein
VACVWLASGVQSPLPTDNGCAVARRMNLHMPQSVTTMNELRELAAVTTQVISPRECKPIISICQDVALGVYKMTRPGVSVDARMLCNLLCPIRGAPAKMHAHIAAKRPVAGRLLLSSILPTACNYRGGEGVVIERGWIRQGTINKPVYQGRSAGLLHTVFMEEGGSAARDLLDNTQRLCVDWLMSSGFSTGLSDLFVDAPTQSALDEVIRDMKSQVYDIIRCTHQGTFHNATFATDAEHFESVVNGLLNQANNRAGEEALRHISDDTNRMVHMIRAMSKGNTLNIAQMMACLGQQNVDGKRIAYGFDGRTLPHFTRYDDGPTARGFVESSFFQGLAPEEFFFHSMGGREGLIDTAGACDALQAHAVPTAQQRVCLPVHAAVDILATLCARSQVRHGGHTSFRPDRWAATVHASRGLGGLSTEAPSGAGGASRLPKHGAAALAAQGVCAHVRRKGGGDMGPHDSGHSPRPRRRLVRDQHSQRPQRDCDRLQVPHRVG